MWSVWSRPIAAATAATIALTLPSVGFAQRAANGQQFIGSLFTGVEQYENFNRINELLPTSAVAASASPQPFVIGAPETLPETLEVSGAKLNTLDFLKKTDTAALLVLRDGRIVYERYDLTGGPKVPWLAMSVSKSLISALVGIAVEEGKIASIQDPITKYLPDLAGSAYDGVTIKNILQMSSGAKWDETYGSQTSGIAQIAARMVASKPLRDLPATLAREHAPGKKLNYNSAETMVLGFLLEKVTGQSVARYTQDKLWTQIGTEARAFWWQDATGSALAFAGFNATAHDYARFGELYRNGGLWKGKQVVPASWVKASITPDAPYLMPRKSTNGSNPWGYGYQWWVLGVGEQAEYSAVGVYNQFIYVNPKERVTIVKLSANSEYGGPATQGDELKTIALFRALAATR